MAFFNGPHGTASPPKSSGLPAQRPKTGDTLQQVAAASYLNYFVSNGIVLVPTYTGHGTPAEKEQRVSEIFKAIFPDRKQVWIDCLELNWNGGGIHCSTQQQPARKP